MTWRSDRVRASPSSRAGAADAGVRSGTFAEVAAEGEILVLAVAGARVEEALETAGTGSFDGKVVIDVTNPLAFEEGKPPALAVGFDDSGGEQVQRAIPGARVVKAWNIVGSPYMVDPDLPGGPPTMFIAGDDDGAKATVTEILDSFGWPETIDIGGIEGSRQLEPLCLLWVGVGIRGGRFDHAFKLLRG